MPTFVNKTTAIIGPTATPSITYTPTAGNAVLVCLQFETGTASVAGVSDNAGLDTFGNAINTWQNLGSISQSGRRIELWGCVPIITAPTQIQFQLTNVQNNIKMLLLEYSGVSTFGNYGATSNTGYSDLFFQGTATQNSDILVSFFSTDGSTPNTGSGTYNVPGVPNFVITPAVVRAVIFSGYALLGMEQTVINNPELLISQVYSVNIPPSGNLAVGVTLNGGFALATPPGFSDIDLTQLEAGDILHALKVNQISQNASLGMARPEFFYTTQVNGDTVEAPISPIDSYQYSRDELIYIYTPYTTFSVESGWTSAPGILFYALWDVDPLTGSVTVQEFYHPDGNSPVQQTNDGQLIVLTVAQRGMSGTVAANSSIASGITMKQSPSFTQIDSAAISGQDVPVTESAMQQMASVSKFAAVKAEVFYMGEFVDGQTVTPPISYADGYKYSYDECVFISSWLWTSAQNGFGPPPMASANGSPDDGGWSQMNQMRASVSAAGVVTCRVDFYNHQAIDPTQPANGGQAFGRLRVYCFTQRNKGPFFSIPVLNLSAGSSGSVTNSLVTKLTGMVGSVTGNLTVTIQAGSVGNMPVTKVVILKTALGGNTVLSNTTLWTGGTVNAGTQFETAPVSYTFDDAHDYYLMAVVSNGLYAYADLTAGVLNEQVPQPYGILGGDFSSATTISSIGLIPQDTLWYIFSAIHLNVSGDGIADEFQELPLQDQVAVFVPGNVLPYNYFQQLAENCREAAYAVEFFGPTNHVFGDTVPLPVSPADGYHYSRDELIYIWQWHDTGTPVIRLFGWGASIDQNGLINLMVWHVHDGGPIANNFSGASIDVLTIACRKQLTNAAQSPLAGNNGNPPSDLSSLQFGGNGGFIVNGGS